MRSLHSDIHWNASSNSSQSGVNSLHFSQLDFHWLHRCTRTVCKLMIEINLKHIWQRERENEKAVFLEAQMLIHSIHSTNWQTINFRRKMSMLLMQCINVRLAVLLSRLSRRSRWIIRPLRRWRESDPLVGVCVCAYKIEIISIIYSHKHNAV